MPDTSGFSEWLKYSPQLLLSELKRLNESNQRIEDKIDVMNEQLTRHAVFIEEAKDKDILSQISHNTAFRTNANKLVWKLIGVGITSAGGITAFVNYLSGAFTK